MPLAARKTFPKGTIVRLVLVVPGSNNSKGDGFVYTADAERSASQIEKAIREKLLPRFKANFLDLDL